MLARNFCEERKWEKVSASTVHMLCDARSTPPRVAAVLVIDGKIYWSDWEPDQNVMNFFQERNDGQIMSLELLSIAFGK